MSGAGAAVFLCSQRLRLIWVASVNKSITSPISASFRRPSSAYQSRGVRHRKDEQNPCGGKKNRSRDYGMLQPPGYQTIEKDQRYETAMIITSRLLQRSSYV